MIGFLAQDLEQYFPQLVATDSDGYKSVYYAQMTPILVEAIREINTKIAPLPTFEDPSLAEQVRVFLQEVAQGIVRSKQLCTEDVCVDKQQLKKMIEYINAHDPSTNIPVVVQTTPEESVPAPEPEEPVSEEPIGETLVETETTSSTTETVAPILE